MNAIVSACMLVVLIFAASAGKAHALGMQIETPMQMDSPNKGITKHTSEPLIFGIVPQQSAKTLASIWGPFIQALSDKTGYDIRFATAPSIPIFEARLAAGEYDIAYMNPYHYAMFSVDQSYRAIAKQADKHIQGIIVVKKDAKISTLEELAGQKIAFPAPLAFAATLIPQSVLKQKQIEIEPVYVRSHDSVYLNVAKGFFTAGGGIVRTLDSAPAEVSDNLRILWTSNPYTPHAFAVNSTLSDTVASTIADALTDLDDATLLEPLGFSKLSAAEDSDWDAIRALNINVSAQP
uniref:phosphate/phosphite/phosphonate ABC transporter substrate-binding protein n=1 Tax=Ningiella ruwaisensis TaxID=2364274 RepID=UPI001F4FA74D|nr:phosphate/phosphite/phosphonate ABC transporter substrate-binding protein [Ningiella ruwaisensis]